MAVAVKVPLMYLQLKLPRKNLSWFLKTILVARLVLQGGPASQHLPLITGGLKPVMVKMAGVMTSGSNIKIRPIIYLLKMAAWLFLLNVAPARFVPVRLPISEPEQSHQPELLPKIS